MLRRLVDDEGVTVLAVSHDARLNASADRLVRLDHGSFVGDQVGAHPEAAS